MFQGTKYPENLTLKLTQDFLFSAVLSMLSYKMAVVKALLFASAKYFFRYYSLHYFKDPQSKPRLGYARTDVQVLAATRHLYFISQTVLAHMLYAETYKKPQMFLLIC